MTIPPSDDLLLRYFAGTLRGEDADVVCQYLEATPERRGLLVGFRDVMYVDVLTREQPDAQSSLDRLLGRIASEEIQTQVLLPRSSDNTVRKSSGEYRLQRRAGLESRPLRGIWLALAGITLATFAMLAVMANGHGHDTYTNGPVSTYVTGNGERATVTLPDGNTVMLNPASRLDVPADYLGGNHTLRLRGEALFTIPHHAGRPVTVVAGQTVTRVLGTSFVVRRYETDTITTVAVREGKVAVDHAVVIANRMIEVYPHGITRVRPATAAQFSFAAGILTLDEMDLPDVIPELNRWYDVDIRLGDSALATRGVGGIFAAGSPADLSTILELSLDVRVVRDGRILTLYPRR